jgi:hypothetical protein
MKQFETPSKTSPKGGRRGCLCKDKDTYSVKCCKGKIINQGIGNISRGVEFLAQENESLILQENNSNIIT